MARKDCPWRGSRRSAKSGRRLGITSLRKHQVTSIKPPPAQWVQNCLTPRLSGWKINIDRLHHRGEESSSRDRRLFKQLANYPTIYPGWPTSRPGSFRTVPSCTRAIWCSNREFSDRWNARRSSQTFVISRPETRLKPDGTGVWLGETGGKELSQQKGMSGDEI